MSHLHCVPVVQQYALTTAGVVSSLYSSATMYWQIFLALWVVLSFVGFYCRTNFKLNQYLFAPAEEISRNNGAIDWDCPGMRFRRNMDETNPVKIVIQKIVFNLVRGFISVAGCVYFLLSNRKNLGP